MSAGSGDEERGRDAERAASRSRSPSRERFDETPIIRGLHAKFVDNADDRRNGNYTVYMKLIERFKSGGEFYDQCVTRAKGHSFYKRTYDARFDPTLHELREGFVDTLKRDLAKIYGENNISIQWTPVTTIYQQFIGGAITDNRNGPAELTVKVTWATSEDV